MKKRIQAILAAFLVVFLLIVDCTPVSYAVFNPAFIYSAMFSFLLSSGYSFDIDADSTQEVTDLMGDLYSQYTTYDSSAYSLIDYDGKISLSQFGQYLFTQTAVVQLQGFADWIKSNFSIVDAGPPVVVAGSSSGPSGFVLDDYTGLSEFVSGFMSPPVLASRSPLTFSYTASSNTFYGSLSVAALDVAGDPVYTFFLIHHGRAYKCACSKQNFIVTYEVQSSSSGNSTSTYSPSLNSFNNNSFYIYASTIGTSSSTFDLDFPANYSSNSSTNAASAYSQCAYIICYGTYNSSLASSMAASIGSVLVDLASQVSADDTLVVDVGLGAGATESDAVETVIPGIMADTLPVVDSQVVPSVVVDTPVQSYPDFDDLGLPQLGLALVERFPFCIPYDFVHLISIFEEEPEAPYIRIDLFPDPFKQKLGITGNTAFELDLGSDTWSWIGTVSRWATLIGFCFVMLTLTKRLIWTS